jgi:hypothetical protein
VRIEHFSFLRRAKNPGWRWIQQLCGIALGSLIFTESPLLGGPIVYHRGGKRKSPGSPRPWIRDNSSLKMPEQAHGDMMFSVFP